MSVCRYSTLNGKGVGPQSSFAVGDGRRAELVPEQRLVRSAKSQGDSCRLGYSYFMNGATWGAEDSGVVPVRLSETTRQPRQLKGNGYEQESEYSTRTSWSGFFGAGVRIIHHSVRWIWNAIRIPVAHLSLWLVPSLVQASGVQVQSWDGKVFRCPSSTYHGDSALCFNSRGLAPSKSSCSLRAYLTLDLPGSKKME